MGVRRHLQVVQLVGVHGGGTQGPYAAVAHEAVQGLHGLLHGGGVVETVDDVQVEVVGAQALERARDLPLNGLGTQVTLIEVDLGGQHHVLARDAEVPQGLPDVLLAGAVGVDVGGVDKGDAELERAGDDGLGGGLAGGDLAADRAEIGRASCRERV